MTQVKRMVWFLPSDRSDHAASVDRKKIGYGKENAVELTEDQLTRLRDAGVKDLQTEEAPKPDES
jgi:hypothetical protein